MLWGAKGTGEAGIIGPAPAIEEARSEYSIGKITRTPISAPYVFDLIRTAGSDTFGSTAETCPTTLDEVTKPSVTHLSEQDERLLRRAIAISARAMTKGNMAFGALLADAHGNILREAQNTTFTDGNALKHAETNLMNSAVTTLTPEQIATATLYTSCEPCAMCSGAMYWGGLNRMVYAMSEHDLLEITGVSDHCPTMRGVGCRNILDTGQRHIEVSGPHLVEEASAVQVAYFAARPPENPGSPGS